MHRTGLRLGLALVALCGCNSSEYDLVPVSGTVTLNDEPLEGARVAFAPTSTGEDGYTAGPSSFGATGPDGRYSLQTREGDDGAVVGPHRITIATFQGEVDRSGDMAVKVIRKEEVPMRYAEPGALEFDVPADGTDQADFPLEAP